MEYFIGGKKGNGKGIQAVGLIKDYLERGKPVATNLNLFLEHLTPPTSRAFVYRLPDRPRVEDLVALGSVDTKGDEDKNGLIVLDEVLTWLNSRDFSEKGRKDLFNWFIHSRKYGWDVCYIGQAVEHLDKQFRDSFVEMVVRCWRLDRMPIPFVGWIFSLFTGDRTRLPKIFIGRFHYGTAVNAPCLYSKWRIGGGFYKAYDTLQRFQENGEVGALSCTLPAWHVFGRHKGFWEMYRQVILGTVAASVLLTAALFVSVGAMLGYRRPVVAVVASAPAEKFADSPFTSSWSSGGSTFILVKDGRVLRAELVRETSAGRSVLVDGLWYRAGS